ncbi:hypothetical protein C8R47DRAFT_517268 [Mycena vitilis]|nr:hypothetical protein C8R47DRAFT_517268 [Mycena vitilis]
MDVVAWTRLDTLACLRPPHVFYGLIFAASVRASIFEMVAHPFCAAATHSFVFSVFSRASPPSAVGSRPLRRFCDTCLCLILRRGLTLICVPPHRSASPLRLRLSSSLAHSPAPLSSRFVGRGPHSFVLTERRRTPASGSHATPPSRLNRAPTLFRTPTCSPNVTPSVAPALSRPSPPPRLHAPIYPACPNCVSIVYRCTDNSSTCITISHPLSRFSLL